ncbi:uncharacterized protein LOC121982800 [Zingiber officinale]|uniref:SAM domain-containing protein n=1 Tax=Zingiber officinale TaxID=94328 RepID=A0A8J5GLS3_ZINOF|nr:uncharacterized protein LOC121982800 [Zingiber officinale]KAG6505998.1 hypothetical protein ZIOFF_031312 [Zingiber officinale]
MEKDERTAAECPAFDSMEDLQLSEPLSNGGATELIDVLAAPLPGTKRQRHPSVRLGEIGDQPAAIPSDPLMQRPKQWKLSAPGYHAKPRVFHHRLPSKTCQIVAKLDSRGDDGPGTLPPLLPTLPDNGVLLSVDDSLDSLVPGVIKVRRDLKSWRGARRVQSNWVLKADEGMEDADFKTSGGEDAANDGFTEGSDSLSRRRTRGRVRVSDSRGTGPVVEGEAPSDMDGVEWIDPNGFCHSEEDGGVRSWLKELGLSRYAPIFEIHEVDDEVLPLLTLDDLKDEIPISQISGGLLVDACGFLVGAVRK